MDESYYRSAIRSIRPHKRLGQHFLVKRYVAVAEADLCMGKEVIELGPGAGILTEELCKVAKRVTAVEIDTRLYSFLVSNLKSPKLEVINSDFFELERVPKADMMASNVPYKLSSKTLMWLVEHRMPAVLCLQREFVDRMAAGVGTGGYSRLSVFCSLSFDISMIMKVPADSFYPAPRVDSTVVQLKPKAARIKEGELRLLSLIMEHKNKKLRNAIEDSSKALGLSKTDARAIADAAANKDVRVCKMEPRLLLGAARELSSRLE